MKLHIDFPLQPWTNKLKCSDKLGFVGSCFSTEIGAQCKNIGIDTIINPFGTIFNPNSILELFSEKSIDKSDTIYDGKVYKYWHSTIHESTEQNQLIDDVNNTKDSFLQNLKSMKAIFITLGTNWVYRFVENDKLVGNCHKIPQNSFKKELLSFNKTTIILSQITERIQQINPSIQVIYTLSPVRHIKDGIEENQYSKSTLRAAIGQICDSSPALYFPSYES